MVGARLEVFRDPAHNGIFVAPRDDRVEEAITDLRQVVFGETAAQ